MRRLALLLWLVACGPQAGFASELLARARWTAFVDSGGTPKLMLAVPDDMHPVLVFMDCDPSRREARITLEVASAPETGHTVPLTLRVGDAVLRRDARGETESPTGPYLEIRVPLRHPFWDALAGGTRLTAESPALARPVTLGLRTMPQPLRAFRRACDPAGR